VNDREALDWANEPCPGPPQHRGYGYRRHECAECLAEFRNLAFREGWDAARREIQKGGRNG
jgi:hypothetical protein